MPNCREEIPRSRDQPLPSIGAKEEGQINQAIEQPESHGKEMPMATDAQIVSSTGKRNPGRNIYGFIHRCPECVLGNYFLGELLPFTARGAVLVPIQPGVIGEDLDSATDQQSEEQKIDIVSQAQPKGETE